MLQITPKIERFADYFPLLSVGVLFFYLFPLLHGDEVLFRIHDYLDIAVSSFKILADSGKIFASSSEIIPNMMGGLPRSVYGSEWNYLVWLFYFFKPINALIINEVLIHTIAFVSMRVLLLKLMQRSDPMQAIVVELSALLFAMVPFYPLTGLGVALLPYTFYVLLHFREKTDTYKEWIGLVLIPFFGNFVLVYTFFIIVSLIWLSVESVYRKEVLVRPIAALIGLFVLFLAVEYRLVYAFLGDGGFISHRVEFIRKCVDFPSVYRGIHNAWLFGQSHSINLQFPYIIITIHLAMIVIFVPRRLNKFVSSALIFLFIFGFYIHIWEGLLTQKWYLPVLAVWLLFGLFWLRSTQRLFYGVLLLMFIFCVWYGFWYYEIFYQWTKEITLLRIYDFSRFILLLTPMWYILLGYAFWVIVQKIHWGWIIAVSMGMFQIMNAFENPPFSYVPNGLNFRSFYAQKSFDEIKHSVGEKQESYRIGSIGIFPSVSLYNGFYTVDGYAANYPIEYKHRFIELNAYDIVNDLNIAHLLQNWGNKCYFKAGLYDYDNYMREKEIAELHINIKQFKAMGGRYLISGYRIRDETKSHVRLIKYLKYNDQSYWDIYLYSVL